MSHAQHEHNSGHGQLGHIVPLKVYFTILLTLLFLTIVTVWISRHDFGVMNIVVAMGIASVKATLVALFFMHLKYESPTTWVYAFFPIFLLLLLIAGVFIDNPYRVAHQPIVPVSTVVKGAK